jgi:hypothetical protein
MRLAPDLAGSALVGLSRSKRRVVLEESVAAANYQLANTRVLARAGPSSRPTCGDQPSIVVAARDKASPVDSAGMRGVGG